MITLVCLGDSITQGYPYEQEASWVHILDHILEDVNLINAGINGHTSGDMLARYHQDVSPHHPQMVIILAGTNDAWQGIELGITVNNLTQLVNNARAEGALPVLGLPTPIIKEQVDLYFPGGNSTDFTKRLDDIRGWIKTYASQNQVEVLDFYTPLCITGTVEGNSEYFMDGGHPSRQGYQVLAESISQRILGIIKNNIEKL